jgi:predicted ABC-type transport system involved in lysophospholipase L1 biosynthesis ATPase subunit
MNNEIRVHPAVSDVPPPSFEPGARPLRAATAPPPEAAARPASQAMILFDGVTKTYQGGVIGLTDVSVQIDKGEFVFLVGPSGSGKSTFIKLLLKELDATSGNLIVGGRSLPKLKRSKVPTLRRNIGCVFQDFKLLPNRSVYQNVAYALQVQGKSRAEIRKKVPDIIGLVGLADKSDRFPHELSGGEQQRVSVARVREPSAAPDRRRADREPRPGHVRGHHAAALPHQPGRHDRRHGDARPRDGRQDAPARDPARVRTRRPRRPPWRL